ncbi:MAG: hypothetical protein LBM19_02710 [Holosporales bacterium]|jgi:hypothetical protein|nr:hypothetical protein [Holosporales bacterium]
MVTLKTLFQTKQREMLESMHRSLTNPVAQGNNTEGSWKEFFKKYLPSRYSCDCAFIIDCEGNFSEQIDIVIYDNYFSPIILNDNDNKYISAESVYAIFEVKPELNKKNFEYAQKKIASVRRLTRTSAKVLCNGKQVPGREPFYIIGGLLSIRNKWENKLIKQKINTENNETLNIGCCIEERSWILKKCASDGFKYVWSKESESSLLTFFMALLNELQSRGTVPAMEIPKYYDGFK